MCLEHHYLEGGIGLMPSFLTDNIMRGTDWRALERAVARLMILAGWDNVEVVGETGDNGADIIGVRAVNGVRKTWVVQVKAKTMGEIVGSGAVKEVMNAMSVYGANIAVVATNGDFADMAKKRQKELKEQGFDLRLWNGRFLMDFLAQLPQYPHLRSLRPYQDDIVNKAKSIYDNHGKRALYIVATGLGKTVIASRIFNYLWEKGNKRFLVLCHAQDLALQLEQSFWKEISKDVPTRTFFGGRPPLIYDGINFGLYQTFSNYLNGITENDFDVVIVDEAHHALANGFASCLNSLKPNFLIGMTATPWRGDGQSMATIFGNPIASVSLVDGMNDKYLAEVDYRLFCDNIDWEKVHNLSRQKCSIKDLNKKLFLPQRDDAIISQIKKTCAEVSSPRIIVFSPSIEHAKQFAVQLTSAGISCVSLSGEDKFARRKNLMDFSAGKNQAVTAVDVLNEGIDVPNVNILVFLRATHSRRIFIQQLGRGLRISDTKKKVIVLDFVSDIRRIAEVIQMNKEGKEKAKTSETMYLKNGFVHFSNQQAGDFMQEWLADMADVSNFDENEKLAFPEDYHG